jgi:hypothetical protein
MTLLAVGFGGRLLGAEFGFREALAAVPCWICPPVRAELGFFRVCSFIYQQVTLITGSAVRAAGRFGPRIESPDPPEPAFAAFPAINANNIA